MSLQTRVRKLEGAVEPSDVWDLTLLTDAELEALIACYEEANERGTPAAQLITPELSAALERVRL
ncbi:MAG TPA: hypothetical protein VF791_04205 [Pyrinomonadaceae bacterium]